MTCCHFHTLRGRLVRLFRREQVEPREAPYQHKRKIVRSRSRWQEAGHSVSHSTDAVVGPGYGDYSLASGPGSASSSAKRSALGSAVTAAATSSKVPCSALPQYVGASHLAGLLPVPPSGCFTVSDCQPAAASGRLLPVRFLTRRLVAYYTGGLGNRSRAACVVSGRGVRGGGSTRWWGRPLGSGARP